MKNSETAAPAGLLSFPDAATRVAALVARLDELLRTACARKGHAVLAVSGGRSPVPLFEALRMQPLPWSNIRVTLVDERLVAADHPDSNEGLVRRHLLQDRAAAARLQGLAGDPAAGLERCAEEADRQALRADVAILGMGDDGHTASLFAGAAGYEQAMDPQCPRTYVGLVPPQAPHPRISLSLRALLEVPDLLLSIEGEHKRMLFASACAEPGSVLPIARLLHARRAQLPSYWSP